MELEFSIQYSHPKDSLPWFYRTFQSKYKRQLTNIVKFEVAKVISTADPFDFWKARKDIGSYLKGNITQKLKKEMKINVVSLQIEEVDLSRTMESSILKTEMTKWTKKYKE